MYALSVRMCKDNDKFEKFIPDNRNPGKSLEEENERIIDELNCLRRNAINSSKCKTCDFLRIVIEDLCETLSKFPINIDKLDMVVSNRRDYYNKTCLGNQRNKC